MLHPAERTGRGPDGLGRDPEQERHGDRRERVRDVVPAGDAQLVDGQDRAIGDGHDRLGRRAGEGQALDAVGDDPAIDGAEPARRRAVEPVGHGPPPAEACVTGRHRVVEVDDERPGRIGHLGEPALDRPGGLERPCRSR
jgi:hypothetical protein